MIGWICVLFFVRYFQRYFQIRWFCESCWVLCCVFIISFLSSFLVSSITCYQAYRGISLTNCWDYYSNYQGAGFMQRESQYGVQQQKYYEEELEKENTCFNYNHTAYSIAHVLPLSLWLHVFVRILQFTNSLQKFYGKLWKILTYKISRFLERFLQISGVAYEISCLFRTPRFIQPFLLR